jgi:methylthioribose-1-phosphate isomerase
MTLLGHEPCSLQNLPAEVRVSFESETRPLVCHEKVLYLLDQRCLPRTVQYLACTTIEEVATAIREMVVRGAPAIGIVAAFGFAQGVSALAHQGIAYDEAMIDRLDQRLRQTRPTAVNLMWALDRMTGLAKRLFQEKTLSPEAQVERLFAEAQTIETEDVASCRAMGMLGASLLKAGARLQTHCNAGAIATGGYGTALGVVRAAFAEGKCSRVYVDETRPRFQGASLTAWELHREGIPVTLISDNMAGALHQAAQVDAIFVGADRITANGDTANKIGTYALAVLAKAHGIPFYVVAPRSTYDTTLTSGALIPIEERDAREVTHVGEQAIAPEGVSVWNPGFDVTPADLITAHINETGVLYPPYTQAIAAAFASTQL